MGKGENWAWKKMDLKKKTMSEKCWDASGNQGFKTIIDDKNEPNLKTSSFEVSQIGFFFVGNSYFDSKILI